MEKIKYKILRKNIPEVELVSLTSQNWYDSDNELVPWSGSMYIGPNQNDIFYNTTGSLSIGYYKWTGTTWNSISKQNAYDNHNLPIYLNSSVDEMGVMVGFDGDIEQIEQIVNFSYTQTGSTIQVFSTVNPDKLRKIVEQTYTINFGDGSVSGLTVNSGIVGQTLPNITHTYVTPSGYTIDITLNSPWTIQKLSKKITVPKNVSVSNPLGTFTGSTVPAYSNLTGQTQNYLNDYDYAPGYTGYTSFTYLSIGKSRISEKKLYGSNSYSGVTGGTDSVGIYSAYTIDSLFYKDYTDGYTLITGTTSAYTKEEVFNNILTRDEHFLGFIDDPVIYSDVFVERGKQGVMEKNLRLGEIETIGELELYGNGYFIIKNQ